VTENLLLRCMPDEIASDLMGAGAPFRVGAGNQVDRDLLGGSHVFIVTEGIASKFLHNSDGRISEVGMVGREAIFPVSALLRVSGALRLVVAQVGPLAGRVIRTKEFHAIVDASEEARELINTYIYAFIVQVGSNLMTSEQNPVAARIARWLLMCHDRIDGDTIHLTHEALADMSFAHRPTVTKVLSDFRAQGLIGTSRAQVEILSRAGLAAEANGSYGASTRYYDEHICAFGKGPGEGRDDLAA
jgi:CRP-like cAMP-binding protein